jgi:hypothetical protein
MSETGFDNESLRYNLINATEKDLKKVSLDTSVGMGQQLNSIESSSRNFSLLKNQLETVSTAITEVNTAFKVVASEVETNERRLNDVCDSMIILEANIK